MPLGRTVRFWGTALCAAVAFFVLAASASAASFCVDVNNIGACPLGATSEPSIDAAIAASSDLDSIYIASGRYETTAGFDFTATRVKVTGVGPTPPVLAMKTPATGTAVITTSLKITKFENLALELPAGTDTFTGVRVLAGNTTLSNVSVSGDGGTGFEATGQNPGFSHVSTNFSGAASYGIKLNSAASTTIDDADLTAHDAVVVDQSQGFLIKRLTAHAARGLHAERSSGTISSSLLAPNPDGAMNVGGEGVYVGADSVSSDVRVDNVTVIGQSGQTGIQSHATGSQPSTVTVNSSLVMGFTDALRTAKTSSGAANLTAQYTRYQGTLNDGSGNPIGNTASSPIADPGFVPGTYRPSLSSPLVDTGDPGPLDPTDSGDKDLDGNPRVVSRGAGMIRDVGAYEVQNSAPQPVITIVTPTPSTTSAVQFSAAASSDADGDALAFDWKFDGTSFATGATAAKLFNTEGPHVVQLTAIDKTGSATTITQQFNVAKGFLSLALKSQNAHLTSSGTFSIRITCPATAATDCTGRLLFRTVKKLAASQFYVKPSKKKSRPKTISAGNHVFRVAPGTTARAKVRAYRTFRNVLKKYSKIKIQSTLISGSTANATLTSNRATFTISAPKKKK